MYYTVPKHGHPFIPMVAPPATRTAGEPSCPVSYHGSDRFVKGAIPTEKFWRYLPVAQQNIGELLSYGITEDGTEYLLEDYSGPGISDRDRNDEVDYLSPTIEWDALDRWNDNARDLTRDRDEYYCTTTLEQHLTGVDEAVITFKDKKATARPATDNYIGDEARNAYIEGADGFTSRKLLDETLTRKYHARLLNVYLDKQGTVAIGSIRIRKNAEGLVYAECVAGYCELTSEPFDPATIREKVANGDRTEAEEFILGIVRHGNNHAAKWFRERETYYKVHASACDLKCDPNSANCNFNDPKPNPLSDDEIVQFLFEHQQFCKDAKCKCDERLSELVPALTYKEAV